MIKTLPTGTKVRLTRNVERYPHFIAPEAATGVVVMTGKWTGWDTPVEGVFSVRIDEPIAGAEAWDNEVHWGEGENPQQDLVINHALTCAVLRQRVELDAEIEAALRDPNGLNLETLKGARPEYYGGGDQESEGCDCGAMGLFPGERTILADALEAYAEGVEEVLRDDEPEDGRDEFPVVEDYQADADRIRMGEQPLHELTREVLRDDTGPAASSDDPADFLALVEKLYR